MAMVSRHGPVANRIDPGRIYNSEREGGGGGGGASVRISKKKRGGGGNDGKSLRAVAPGAG